MPSKWQWFGWRWLNRTRAFFHPLEYFFWEATLNCPLECRHCGSDCRKSLSHHDLPKEKVLSVFRNVAQHYSPHTIMVGVTGGEPLARHDLFEILSEVHALGFPWGMVTNGWSVTPEVVEQCRRTGMRTVSVSVDGLQDRHDWLRHREGSFARAVQALRLFVAQKTISKVEVITCVHQGNIADLPILRDFLREIGVSGWRLLTIFPKGRAELHAGIVVNGPLLRELFAFIEETHHQHPNWDVSYSEEGFLGHPHEGLVRPHLFFCNAGISIGSLLADGSYGACPSLGREWTQGHVDDLPFAEAWEKRYRRFRQRSWRENRFCTSCDRWTDCRGSSLHLWDTKNHRPRICHLELLKENPPLR